MGVTLHTALVAGVDAESAVDEEGLDLLARVRTGKLGIVPHGYDLARALERKLDDLELRPLEVFHAEFPSRRGGNTAIVVGIPIIESSNQDTSTFVQPLPDPVLVDAHLSRARDLLARLGVTTAPALFVVAWTS